MKKLGIIVARFQVSSLHAGHRHLIHSAMSECERVIVFLGHPKDGQYFTEKNPISFFHRKGMILKDYPNVEVHAIADQDTNLLWVELLDYMIEGHVTSTEEPILYGSRDSFIPIYIKNDGRYETKLVSEIPKLSGTKEREEVRNSPYNSEDFRRGIIYAALQSNNKNYLTVIK